MSIQMVSQDRVFGRLIWFPYELIDLEDGESKVVWDHRATHPYGVEVPFQSKNPVRVQRAVAHLLKELGLYLGDAESAEWSRKVLAYTQDYHLAPDIWDCLFGHTPGWGDDWFHDEEAFKDQSSLPFIDFGLTLSPYQSHTSIPEARKFYLQGLFPFSPYCWAMQAIDALYRHGEAGVQYAWNKLASFKWDGVGTTKSQTICMVSRDGEYIYPSDWLPMGAETTPPVDCFEWGTGGIIPSDWVYKGDWITLFLCAACLLYSYAHRYGYSSIAQEAKTWADEAATTILKMQVPPTGIYENSRVGSISLPHAAGGFIDAFYVNGDGSLQQHGWQSKALMAAEWMLRNFHSYEEQPIDTLAFGGYFENSLYGLHGLLLYKSEVLGG